jgi:hypothetical protein
MMDGSGGDGVEMVAIFFVITSNSKVKRTFLRCYIV